MTQGKTHPPTKPFTPDPTRESSHIHRDPASDLPTDPPRHDKDHQHGKTGSDSKKSESHRSGSGTHSTRGGTSAQHAKAGSQSHKNK